MRSPASSRTVPSVPAIASNSRCSATSGGEICTTGSPRSSARQSSPSSNRRGAGFFYALELVKDKETRETFSAEECETLLRGFLSPALFERGLNCRADDRGDPVIQISPPLVAGQTEFDEMVGILGDVLTEAGTRMHAA